MGWESDGERVRVSEDWTGSSGEFLRGVEIERSWISESSETRFLATRGTEIKASLATFYFGTGKSMGSDLKSRERRFYVGGTACYAETPG